MGFKKRNVFHLRESRKMKNIVKFSGYEDGVKNKYTFNHEKSSTKM